VAYRDSNHLEMFGGKRKLIDQ